MLNKAGEVIEGDIWINKIVYDPTTKKLTVKDYEGLNPALFEDTRLMFQSQITLGEADLSNEYQLAKLTIKEKKELEPEPPLPTTSG